MNNIFIVLFHYLLPFFRQLHNSFQNVLSFWAKNYSRCLLQSSREWKFFPLREFYKDQNKRKSEGAMSGEYGGWIRTSQPSSNSFAWSSKKHAVLRYPNGRLYLFCWLILDAFHQSSATFNWSNWEQYLLELITCFPEELIIEGSLPILPYTQHHLLWMRAGLWCGWWRFVSLAPQILLFHIIAQYPLFTACHSLFLK